MGKKNKAKRNKKKKNNKKSNNVKNIQKTTKSTNENIKTVEIKQKDIKISKENLNVKKDDDKKIKKDNIQNIKNDTYVSTENDNKIKVSNKHSKKDNKKSIKIFLLIIVIFAIIDILLIMILIKNKNNFENNTIKSESNMQNNAENIIINENNIEFVLQKYKFKMSSDYIVNAEDSFIKLEHNNIKALITINEGTMDNIKNNLELLKAPITNQGGTITLEPELRTITGKEVFVLEYKIDEKNYLIAYTQLDEKNIIDMIVEKSNSKGALEVLVKLSNNYEILQESN